MSEESTRAAAPPGRTLVLQARSASRPSSQHRGQAAQHGGRAPVPPAPDRDTGRDEREVARTSDLVDQLVSGSDR